MNKLLTYSKGLDFLNSLIKDSPTIEIIKNFKEVCHLFEGRELSEDTKYSIGRWY